MELRELKSFVTAAKFRSISKAATDLGLGQPTVTTHIKKLEKELNMVLFDRVTRPIRLTLSGQTIFDLSQPLLDGLDSLAVRTSEAEERGPVTVASTPDIIPHTLLRVVKVFNSLYPNVYLRIQSATRSEVIGMVRTGEVDAGVIQHPDRGDDLHFEPLFLYERVLIAPKGHELLSTPMTSLDSIAKYPLLLMARGTYTRHILEQQLQKRGLQYEVIMELDSMDMIKKFVTIGMGVSVGPRLAIEEEDLDHLGMVSLANFLPVDQAGLITLPGKTLSTPAGQFISVLRDTFAASEPA
ncbi:MAG: LysR family transcriptional regulator [SAR202 cluster bacterium]|jgi:DNA-binding transcriptional LysR family regulator|nr:LysR family transcriptional regulator [SAR202 cluster bacterium]|tara:strand:- start:931 stop:1821 length:891 start_codon:yes stop_codon:yes gene_type:complete